MLTALERRGDTLKRFKGFDLEDKATFNVCRVGSTAEHSTFKRRSVETLLLREGVPLQGFQETGVSMLREYASAAATSYALQPSAVRKHSGLRFFEGLGFG